jgi:hypothetical protein
VHVSLRPTFLNHLIIGTGVFLSSALLTCVGKVYKCWFRWKWCLAISCCPRYHNIDLVHVKGFWQSHCFRSQVTISCAMVMCHRFYMRQSHAKNDWQTIATSSLFLACKAEDEPCQLSSVVVASYEIIYEWDPSASIRIHQTVSVYIHLCIGKFALCILLIYYMLLCL